MPAVRTFDNLLSSFGSVHIYCILTNNAAPLKRNTSHLTAQNEINSLARAYAAASLIIALINIDYLIIV